MADKNRVLIVVQNLPVPFDRRVWLEATTLTRAGFRVSVICPKAKGFNAGHEVLEDIEVFRYPLPIDAAGALGFIVEFGWCFLATALLSLRVALFGRGFDVLHVCNPPETYWPLGLFWRLFGKVFLFDHHDLSPEMYAAKFDRPGGAFYSLLLLFERLTFRVARTVVTTNESHKAIAVQRGGKRPEDVFVVRSGPDLARFRTYEPDPAWRRGRTHLFVYLGEICKQDGVDYLVRALKHLVDDGFSDFHCVLVGGGPHQKAIARYAEAVGMGEHCTFTGRVSDEVLCRVLSSADIGVDPDPKNDWSDKSTMNKVIEYMFFGLPVVAFDLRETRVSAGSAGVYAEPNSERAMADMLRELALAPDRVRVLGAEGSRRVQEELAWSYSVAPLLAAYRRALGRPAAAPAGVEARASSLNARTAGDRPLLPAADRRIDPHLRGVAARARGDRRARVGAVVRSPARTLVGRGGGGGARIRRWAACRAVRRRPGAGGGTARRGATASAGDRKTASARGAGAAVAALGAARPVRVPRRYEMGRGDRAEARHGGNDRRRGAGCTWLPSGAGFA